MKTKQKPTKWYRAEPRPYGRPDLGNGNDLSVPSVSSSPAAALAFVAGYDDLYHVPTLYEATCTPWSRFRVLQRHPADTKDIALRDETLAAGYHGLEWSDPDGTTHRHSYVCGAINVTGLGTQQADHPPKSVEVVRVRRTTPKE